MYAKGEKEKEKENQRTTKGPLSMQSREKRGPCENAIRPA
jgi:hypothetical protein